MLRLHQIGDSAFALDDLSDGVYSLVYAFYAYTQSTVEHTALGVEGDFKRKRVGFGIIAGMAVGLYRH